MLTTWYVMNRVRVLGTTQNDLHFGFIRSNKLDRRRPNIEDTQLLRFRFICQYTLSLNHSDINKSEVQRCDVNTDRLVFVPWENERLRMRREGQPNQNCSLNIGQLHLIQTFQLEQRNEFTELRFVNVVLATRWSDVMSLWSDALEESFIVNRRSWRISIGNNRFQLIVHTLNCSSMST